MGVVTVMIALALLLGGVGLFVEGLRWVLVIAVALALFAAVSGLRSSAARSGRFRRTSAAPTNERRSIP